jgi:predicted dinucleotide-binding enzyme
MGTGGMATAIASLAAKAGYAVEIFSRDPDKAQMLAGQLGASAKVGTFGAPVAGDIVILAVPYVAVLDVMKRYGPSLAGKVLVDITNPVANDLTSFVTPVESFGALEIANTAPPDAIVIKAFNTLFSHILAAGPLDDRPLDVFLAGDDAAAKALVSAFIVNIGLHPMDVGLLQMAKTLEHVCLLSLGLMKHAVKHTNFSINVSLLG